MIIKNQRNRLTMKSFIIELLLLLAVQPFCSYVMGQVDFNESVMFRVPYMSSTMADPAKNVAIVYNNITDNVFCVFGSQVWSSSDSGRSWNRVPIGGSTTFLGTPVLHSSDGRVYVTWQSSLTNSPIEVAEVYKNDVERVVLPMHIQPSGYTLNKGFQFVNGLSVAVSDNDTVDVKWPNESSWDFVSETYAYYGGTIPKMYVAGDSSIGVLLTDTTSLVVDGHSRRVYRVSHGKGVRQFWKVDDSSFIAWREVSSSSMELIESLDGAQTWHVIGTIKGDRAAFRFRTSDNKIIIATASSQGSVYEFKTLDHSLRYIGRASSVQLMDSTMIGFSQNTLVQFKSSSDTFEFRNKSLITGNELLVLNERLQIAVTDQSVYRSEDGGLTWKTLVFADTSYDIIGLNGLGVSSALPIRLLDTKNINPEAIYPGIGYAVTMDGSISRPVTFSTPRYLRWNDSVVSKRGCGLFELRRHSYSGLSGDVLKVVDPSGSQYINIPTKSMKGQSLYFVDSTKWIVFADSVYLTENAGSTWRSIATELPFYGETIVPVSSFLPLNDSTWLTGHRGYTFAGFDTNVVVKGGIYRTTDGGRTWSSIQLNLQFEPYVWHIIQVDSLTLVASVCEATSNAGPNSLIMAQSVIIRSTDGGATFSQVALVDGRSQPMSGLGHRLVVSETNHVYAIGTDLLLESLDKGINWDTVFVDTLYDRYFSDLVCANDSLVWLGTTKGVMKLHRNKSTGVTVETKYRYTSIWGYPNPVGDALKVRVNNLELQSGSSLTLQLYGLSGNVALDLTSHLNQLRGSSGVISADVSRINSGVYLLVLSGGGILEYQKIAIGH